MNAPDGVPSLWLALAALVSGHAGGSVIWVFSTTLLQAHSEDRLRGRVLSADYAVLVLTNSQVSCLAGVLIAIGSS